MVSMQLHLAANTCTLAPKKHCPHDLATAAAGPGARNPQVSCREGLTCNLRIRGRDQLLLQQDKEYDAFFRLDNKQEVQRIENAYRDSCRRLSHTAAGWCSSPRSTCMGGCRSPSRSLSCSRSPAGSSAQAAAAAHAVLPCCATRQWGCYTCSRMHTQTHLLVVTVATIALVVVPIVVIAIPA